ITPGGTGDRDGDGIPDEHDAFPDDPNDAYDFDQDGIGDNADPDGMATAWPTAPISIPMTRLKAQHRYLASPHPPMARPLPTRR
ncbi:hypothetical protein, partial [Thiolapillus sp.]